MFKSEIINLYVISDPGELFVEKFKKSFKNFIFLLGSVPVKCGIFYHSINELMLLIKKRPPAGRFLSAAGQGRVI